MHEHRIEIDLLNTLAEGIDDAGKRCGELAERIDVQPGITSRPVEQRTKPQAIDAVAR